MSFLLAARMVLAVLGAGSIVYCLLAIFAARDFFRERRPDNPAFLPSMSILKPIRGREAGAAACFRSFASQDYPDIQLLFGALDPDDPGLAEAKAIVAEFPRLDARISAGGGPSPGNPKVATLARLETLATGEVLLLSDSDVRVPPGYLRSMVGPLADPGVGVVTSPYRSHGSGFGGLLQALGNASEFQPSVFVARKLEGVRFALGAGILVRREALREIGGFDALGQYVADDLMLGRLAARAGRRVVLALPVVDHELGRVSFSDFARRQIRWNRGIRSARPGGYAGLLVTQSTVIALLFAAVSRGSILGWAAAAAVLAARFAMAWSVGVSRLADPSTRKGFALLPLRDLIAFGLWVAGLFGGSVEWKGRRYRLARGGKIAGEEAS